MNNSNPTALTIAIAIFGAAIVYIIYAKVKRKGASWVGTVVDKNVTESASSSVNDNASGLVIGNRNAVNRSYTIRIKSDSGEEFSWPVGEGFYESTNVGDRLQKDSGTETPVKI